MHGLVWCKLSCNSQCCAFGSATAVREPMHEPLRLSKVCTSGKRLFDSSKSNTYEVDGRKWNISYDTGNAMGFLGIDTVTVRLPQFGG